MIACCWLMAAWRGNSKDEGIRHDLTVVAILSTWTVSDWRIRIWLGNCRGEVGATEWYQSFWRFSNRTSVDVFIKELTCKMAKELTRVQEILQDLGKLWSFSHYDMAAPWISFKELDSRGDVRNPSAFVVRVRGSSGGKLAFLTPTLSAHFALAALPDVVRQWIIGFDSGSTAYHNCHQINKSQNIFGVSCFI